MYICIFLSIIFLASDKYQTTMMHSPIDTFDDITLNQHCWKVSPNSHRELFLCPNNTSKNKYYILAQNPIIPQCSCISCLVCKEKWYLCINCYSQLKHINTRHLYKCHAAQCHERTVFPTP